MSFDIGDVYVVDGMEFVQLRVHGQSFMLHQIRKMVGLLIAVMRGLIPERFLLGEKTEKAAFILDRFLPYLPVFSHAYTFTHRQRIRSYPLLLGFACPQRRHWGSY